MEKRQKETESEMGRRTVMYRCTGQFRTLNTAQGYSHVSACMELERTMWCKVMRESRMPNVVFFLLFVHFQCFAKDHLQPVTTVCVCVFCVERVSERKLERERRREARDNRGIGSKREK